MTRPASSSKVVLVTDRRPASAAQSGSPLRRYRLARLRLDRRLSQPDSRFEHLKRVYD